MNDPAIVTNPLKNEFRHLAPFLLPGIWNPLEAIADYQVSRIINVAPQVDAEVSLKNNPDDGRGIPAQSKGVFRSGRHEPHVEERRHRIQPVGQRQHLTNEGPGQFTFDRSRQILLPDGLADRLRFTVMFRVLAPHNTLQFRKLSDHTSEEVSLTLIRCPLAC